MVVMGHFILFPTYMTLFFGYMGVLEGKGLAGGVQKCKDTMWDTVKAGPCTVHAPLARPGQPGQPSHLSLICFVPEQRSLALARPAVTPELYSEPDA